MPLYRGDPYFVAGLERRVRSLVDGYRELNELVDQAPARVSDAASEYAQAVGLRRTQGSPLPGDGADRDESDEASGPVVCYSCFFLCRAL